MFSFSATIDPVTVLDQMKLRGVYDENTTSNYLLQLMEITPTAANVSEYIRIVKDKALLRRISETAGELTTLVQEGSETGPGRPRRWQNSASTPSARGSPPRAWSLISNDPGGCVRPAARAVHVRRRDVPGMATGFADLDRTLTGFHRLRAHPIGRPTRHGQNVLCPERPAPRGQVLRQERGLLLPGNEPGAAGHRVSSPTRPFWTTKS